MSADTFEVCAAVAVIAGYTLAAVFAIILLSTDRKENR